MATASERDLDLVRLERQRQAALGPHFQASRDGFPDVDKRFVAGLAWLTQPGMEGHSTIQTPSSSRSNVVTNFMGFSLPSFLVFWKASIVCPAQKE